MIIHIKVYKMWDWRSIGLCSRLNSVYFHSSLYQKREDQNYRQVLFRKEPHTWSIKYNRKLVHTTHQINHSRITITRIVITQGDNRNWIVPWIYNKTITYKTTLTMVVIANLQYNPYFIKFNDYLKKYTSITRWELVNGQHKVNDGEKDIQP